MSMPTLKKLPIRDTSKRKWTRLDKKRLRRLVGEGKSTEEISEILNRSKNAVVNARAKFAPMKKYGPRSKPEQKKVQEKSVPVSVGTLKFVVDKETATAIIQIVAGF